MRILFMGTPDFAVKSLEGLYAGGHDICGVFTREDKPKNRGMKLFPSPVKVCALAHGTPVFQPKSLRTGEAFEIIKDLAPQLIVVVAYGRILPKEVLEAPEYGCVNIHGSLLPKYRGSAPVQWSVLNGDKIAGVTAMYMDVGLDTGDIIDTSETEVGDYETSEELFERLSSIGAELLGKTVRAIESGVVSRLKQDDAQATLAPPLTREQALIDWSKTPEKINNQVRGLIPWPVAKAVFGEKTYKIYAVRFSDARTDKTPGSVLSTGSEGILIACGEGRTLLITELQAEGKKRMAAGDYLRGNSLC